MILQLNENWKLLYRDLSVMGERIAEIDSAGDYMDALSLPCDVRMPLIRGGIIKDPVAADYCYESEWVEEKSWWFKNEFTLCRQDLEADSIRLTLESLDLCADVFVNGQLAGSHKNCHYPFEAELLTVAREGLNTLIVRLTAGHETVTQEQLRYIEKHICTETAVGRGDRGDKRRAFLRKPQYVYGWDWAPRVVTIGIMKNAYININSGFAITRLHPVTLEADAKNNSAVMRFELTFESFNPIATIEAQARLELFLGQETVLDLRKEILAQSGTNMVVFESVIENARLWWPNGAGGQPIYSVRASLKASPKAENKEYTAPPVRFGIRTTELNQEKLGGGRRKFAVRINGVDIFCKGANWIPADSIYARITREKYETLIREAKECNFNMLRVWGGGFYEQDVFYDLCDEYGILVWQDFMFSCSLYPDDQAWFLAECEKEMAYQTRRLRHHPCIALWCGNNENQWLFETDYGWPKDGPSGGLVIYNKLAPEIISANCPEIPYWRSSPYGGQTPNCSEEGDRHHWNDCTMHPEMEKRITPEEYDKAASAFVSEYGYVGPCSEQTIQKYFDGREAVRGNRIWNMHNNTFEKDTVAAGIRKHYTEPDALALPEYLQYARLVQGLMYAYSLESIRAYEHNNGSLFWMYTDAWGEVGWTIIDYYLDRKPSYYYVKRAFAPVKTILRRSACGKKVIVTGINDTPDTVRLDLEYGYAGFDGAYDSSRRDISLPPFSKKIALEFDMPQHDIRQGLVFVRGAHEGWQEFPLALLRTGDFKDYGPCGSQVLVEKVTAKGSDYEVTVKSSGFSHAVSFALMPSIRLSDEYFDMLPGETRTILLYDAVGKINETDIKPSGIKRGKQWN
jgi:beta-mannosidase